jgi:hypothetical protein
MRAAATRRDYAVALFSAWHAEMFARCERLPDLAALVARVLDPSDDQDAEEQMDAARAIAATFGGTV